MQVTAVLKRVAKNNLARITGYVFFLAIVAVLFLYSTTILYKIVLLVGVPYLIRLAYHGYPLAYFKLTGRPYEYDIQEANEVEKGKQYYAVTDLGEQNGRQTLSRLLFLLVAVTLILHWYETIIKDIFKEIGSILHRLVEQLV